MASLENYPLVMAAWKMARNKKIDLYCVGGFLRDCALGRAGHDFDFAMKSKAVAFSRSFAKTVKGTFVLLDEEHGCGRVVKKNQRVIEMYDFSDFRARSLKGDLAHRDFTINAFAVHLNRLKPQDSFLDHVLDYSAGMKDLKARRLRMVHPLTFQEDPLRLLRGFSLRAQLGFSIERCTLARIREDKSLLHHVARERILEELFKILQSSRASETLKAMDRIGLLHEVIPQIVLMKSVKQGGYHHLDVWPHSLETVYQLEGVFEEYAKDADVNAYLDEPLAGVRNRRGLLKLAALLHDIGKPQTQKFEKDRMTFHGHEHVGRGIVRSIAKFLLLSSRERMILEDIVMWHLRPGYLSNFKKPSEKALFRYFRDTKTEAASIALLSIADQRSTRGHLSTPGKEKHLVGICRDLVKEFFAKQKIKPQKRLINGDDLIRLLNLKPSKIFAQILRDIEEAQATGQIATKQEALELAKKIASF